MRLKVPPAVNQFNNAIDKNQASTLLRLLKKYVPETRQDKKKRLMEMAQQKKDGAEVKTKKPQIIKGKGRLGQLVHKKKASCVALTAVRQEDQTELNTLANNFKAQFNDNAEVKRRWGGGIMGIKSQHVMQR